MYPVPLTVPRRRRFFRGVTCAGMALIAACQSPSAKKALPPDIPVVPNRIVTLSPSSTALVAALGAKTKIVATDKYSAAQFSLQDRGAIGSFLSPDIEAIIRQKPDLVVADASQANIAKPLSAASIKMVAAEMHTLQDLRQAVRDTGIHLGAQTRAKEILADIDQEVAKQEESPLSPSPKVLLVIDRDPTSLAQLIVAGPNTFADDLLKIVGATNVASSAHTRYPKLSKEEVLRMGPDFILDTVATSDDEAAMVWKEHFPKNLSGEKSAVRFLAADRSWLTTPGPNLRKPLQLLRKMLTTARVRHPNATP